MNIGITGHRHLTEPADWLWVREIVSRELSLFPPPLTAVTSLAIGADQLLAAMVADRGGRIHAILPFVNYQRTFTSGERGSYCYLLSLANVEILHTPGTDEDAYLVAGCTVADFSDVLLAVWDGLPARGRGGTGDVVAFALRNHIPVVHLNPSLRTVVRHGGSAKRRDIERPIYWRVCRNDRSQLPAAPHGPDTSKSAE